MLLHIQHNEEDSIQAKRLALSSRSGALWFNNVSLAKKFLLSYELARLHLCISGRRASIANPVFSMKSMLSISTNMPGLVFPDPPCFDSCNLKKQYKARIQCCRRLQFSLWPVARKMTVTGI